MRSKDFTWVNNLEEAIVVALIVAVAHRVDDWLCKSTSIVERVANDVSRVKLTRRIR